MGKKFVHLHVHSHYSILDGGIKIPDLIQKAIDYEMPAIALTDHGNLFGALEFYQTAKKKNIKPIIGYEAYIAPKSRTLKEKQFAKSYHMTLLARNFDGYKNLIKLATEAYTTGFYHKPRIDKELLKQYSSNLIALSGCLASEANQYILKNKIDKAKESLLFYKEMFPDNFYIEIQQNYIEDQQKVNKVLRYLAEGLNLPMVFTNDIHYLNKEDTKAHEILLGIQTGAKISDKKRFRFASDQFFMKPPKQMYLEAKDFPNAAENTVEIASKIDIEIPHGKNRLPRFDVPEGKTNEQYLKELCEKGLKERYPEITDTIQKRFDYEYNVICRMGFASYFLIVWDFINYARKNGISVGPGRGSAAGSIVSYALRITNLDPLKYNLIFERFLNEGRNEMPDIDIDFETNRRDEVISYVTSKYGRKQVAQIITFGTMAARAVIRDVGRVLEVPLSEVDKIAKKVPEGPKVNLQSAIREDQEFRKVYETNEQAKEIIDIGLKLEGLNRQPGTHAAGIIIADKDISEYCPLYKSRDDTIATQYTMGYLESLGLIKMDFLGLNTLTLVEKVLEIIKKFHGETIDIDKIPLDDKKSYDMLIRGECKGVFQLESDGMRQLVKKLKPDCFEDIIALVALYRPGPLGSGMVDTYCKCKHGQEAPEYKHPVLEKILAETHGVILYQEQVMRIASDLAGFSLPEADKLRKAMGKKKKEIMQEYRVKFIKGAAKKYDVSEKISGETFDLIAFFAGYGFNKSHSAAYALVAYQTAYLKANYPKAFMAGLMTIESQNTDKIVIYIQECEAMNIPCLSPDINISDGAFTPTPEGIRFGLSAIKGVGTKAVASMLSTREKIGKFKSLFHLCEEVETKVVNKQTLEALVKSGAMDRFKRPRHELFDTIPTALQIGNNIQKQKQNNQMTLFDFDPGEEEEQGTDDVEHLYITNEPWNEKQKLRYEKDALGFFLSGHPLKRWQHYIDMLVTNQIGKLNNTFPNAIIIGGMINFIKEITIKKGKRNAGRKMAQITLEDFSGNCRITCFPDAYEQNQALIKEDQIVFIKGKVEVKEDRSQIIAGQVISVEEGIKTLPKTIIIKLDNQTEDVIYQLRKICGNHRGNCKTMLEIKQNGAKALIQVAEKFYLRPDYTLFNEIEQLLDKEAIAFSQ